MITNQIKQTLKGLRATRLFSVINIIGLALGITCTFLLAKYVLFEASTDKFHENYERLYFSTIYPTLQSNPTLLSPNQFFNVDYSQFPQIEKSGLLFTNYEEEIIYNDHSYTINILATDSVLTELLDFSMDIGDLETIMTEPGSIAITSDLAKKLFGNKDAINEQILFNRKPYLVKGILSEFPGNCSMKFDAIFSDDINIGGSKGCFDFILLKENADIETINSQLADVGHSHFQFPESKVSFKPYSSFYFSSDFREYDVFFQFGNRSSLYILSIIAGLILIISVFNFINIYNVTLVKRGKELGIKKVLGAGRFSIAYGFVREVLLLTSLAAIVSFFLLLVLMPGFRIFSEKNINFSFSTDLLLLVAMIVIVTFFTSFFPALKYSIINPIKSIREFMSSRNSARIRKVLMSLQYVITIALIIVSMFFIKQLNFMLNKELGFKTDNIVKVRFFEGISPSDWEFDNQEENQRVMTEFDNLSQKQLINQQYVINEIEKNPFLQNLCFGDDPVTTHSAPWRNQTGDQDYQTIAEFSVSPNFEDLYGLEIVEGRFFNREMDKDRQLKVVINESAKKFFEIESLDDAYLLNLYWGAENAPFKVIGVVKDYNYQHLSNSVQPLVMFFHDDKEGNNIMMHITEGKEAESIAFLKNLFEEVNPTKDFKYEFVEDHIQSLYQEDKKIAGIYTLFAIVAIIISSLGLFSFSVFDVEQRYKEIGIRKVNGAKEIEIIHLLTRNFITVIVISLLIACPLAWLAIQRYLENFAYKTSISGWLFLVAILITFLIAYITLIWQSWRAATKNPVEALRYE